MHLELLFQTETSLHSSTEAANFEQTEINNRLRYPGFNNEEKYQCYKRACKEREYWGFLTVARNRELCYTCANKDRCSSQEDLCA